MFRLVDGGFGSEKLNQLAIFCLTETIKSHLDEYFEDGYENTPQELLYKKVKLAEAYKIYPEKIIKEMKSQGVNIDEFIPKKLAQFMILLNQEEEETPDLFLEYTLYRMMQRQSERGYDMFAPSVHPLLPELKKLLRAYAKEHLNDDEGWYDDIKDRNRYARNTAKVLTEFTFLLGADGWGDDSLAFWDWDFTFFDDIGFAAAFALYERPELGYGVDAMEEIFTGVGQNPPL